MAELGILIIAVVLLVIIWNRFGPHDRDRWHIDPADDENNDAPVQLIGRQAPRFHGDADEVLAELVKIARAERGVRVMDGGIREGMITFVAYNGLFSRRDYLTFKAAYEGEETKLAVAARAKSGFGGGKNEARVERWLQGLRHIFG